MVALLTGVLAACSIPIAAFAQIEADGVSVGIYPDSDGSGHCIEVHSEPRIIDLYVVVRPVPDYAVAELSSVRFMAPELGWGGLVFVDYIPVFPSTVVSLPNGPISVDFGGCHGVPIHVLTVKVLAASAPPDCYYIWVDAVDAQGCDGNPVGMIGGTSRITLVDSICQYVAPGTPYPPDGATNVPTDVTFSWSESPGPNYCANVDWYSVALGATPTPEVVYFSGDTFYDPPYRLQANTTYYWQVSVSGNGPGASSPVWSFSTAGPVSVEKTTWGKIKALYR